MHPLPTLPRQLSTDAVPPHERLACWVDLICATYVQLDCDVPSADGFHGSIASHSLPGLDLSVVRSRAQRVVRTPRAIARASDDWFIVSIQTRGRALISQDGRDAVMGPGDFALYDSTRPYVLQFDEDFEEVVLKLRGGPLRALVQGTDLLTATTVNGHSGAGHLMTRLVDTLRHEAAHLSPASAAAVSSSVLNLLVAGLQSLPACRQAAPSALAAYHVARIRHHVDTHLDDPTLSAESVAAAVGLSVGHLHRLFRSEPLSVSQYLWQQRLDACSRDLLDPRRLKVPVAQIAFARGFNDAAHFSRAFRERFQMSPREWRRQDQTADRAAPPKEAGPAAN